jgi:hypothetical protein
MPLRGQQPSHFTPRTLTMIHATASTMTKLKNSQTGEEKRQGQEDAQQDGAAGCSRVVVNRSFR